MKITLTARGALAAEFQKQTSATVHSIRGLSNEELKKLVEDCDVIIHNAAELHCKDLVQALQSNFILTKRLVDICKTSGRQPLLVLLSSMSMLKDQYSFKPLDEMDNYALSKYLAEHYLLKSGYERKLSVRFSTLFYGIAERDGLSGLVQKAHDHRQVKLINHGVAKRDFIPIALAVKALLQRIYDHNFPASAVINVATGISFSFLEIATYLKKILPHLRIESEEMEASSPVLCEFSPDEYVLREANSKDFLMPYIDEYLQLIMRDANSGL